MSNIPAEALLPLSQSEEATALIGLVADGTVEGDFRYITIAGLAAVQQREVPVGINIERVRLVQYTGVDANNRAVISSGSNVNHNNLAIKQGAIRHNFNDGYSAIEVHFRQKYSSSSGASGDWITEIPIEAFNAPASPTDHRPTFIERNAGDATIYRASDTSFAIYDLSQSATYFLRAIYGLKYVVS